MRHINYPYSVAFSSPETEFNPGEERTFRIQCVYPELTGLQCCTFFSLHDAHHSDARPPDPPAHMSVPPTIYVGAFQRGSREKE